MRRKELWKRTLTALLAAGLISSAVPDALMMTYASESGSGESASTDTPSTETSSEVELVEEEVSSEGLDVIASQDEKESADTASDSDPASDEIWKVDTSVEDYIEIYRDNWVPAYESYGSSATEEDEAFALTAAQANAAESTAYPASSSEVIAALKKKYPATRQQFSGSCWAYSTIASIEFSGIANGTINTGKSTDLSEYGFGYFAYHSVVDPLGGTRGDYYTYTPTNVSPVWYAAGHNMAFTIHTLNQWMALTTEAKIPTPINLDVGVSPQKAYSSDYIVTNVRILDIKSDPEGVKEKIVSNGSVSGAYHSSKDYVSADKTNYYCPSNLGANHAIAIVGWDDHYSKKKFLHTPSGNGAWLVRNSYTTATGLNYYSYFWLSYYDVSLARAVYAFDVEPADQYDHNYQYDGGNYSFGYRLGSSSAKPTAASAPKTANVFTAHSGSKTELLSAVNLTFTQTASVNYRVQIYLDPTNGNPTSGTYVSEATTTGSTNYAGIYTIPLKNPVVLEAGQTFAVVVTVWEGSSGNYLYYAPDREWAYTSWDIMETGVTAASGQSYVYSGSSWSELLTDGQYGNVCIKAFTSDYSTDGKPVRVVLSKTSMNVSKGKTATLTAKVTPAQATNFSKIKWTSSNKAIATVNQKGKITGKKVGTVKITGQALDQNGKAISGVKAVCTVKVVIPAKKITLNATSGTLRVGESKKLTVKYTPTNTTVKKVTWTSSNVYVANVSSAGKVTAAGKGTATITAKCGSVKATFKVKVTSIFDTMAKQSASSTKSVTLKWRKVTANGIKGYLIMGSTSKNGTYLYQDYVSGRSKVNYKFTNFRKSDGNRVELKPGKTYYYQVYAAYVEGNEIHYFAYSGTTITVTKPAKVSGLKFVKASKSAIKIKWKKTTGATGYYIYAATSKNGKYKKIATAKGAGKVTYTYKGLKSKKKYYFKVVAYRKGTSTYKGATSAILTAKTK